MDRISSNASPIHHRHVAPDKAEHKNNAVPQSPLLEAEQPRPALALRNRRPAWIPQMQEGLRHGGNLVRRMAHGVGGILQNPTTVKILAAAGVGQIVAAAAYVVASNNSAARAGQRQQAEAYAEMARLFEQGGKFSMYMAFGILVGQLLHQNVLFIRQFINEQRNLQQPDLAGVPLNEVVAKFRSHQAGSSSGITSDFDWAQPGLFVNDQKEDVAPDISHWLNRIYDAIQRSPQEEASRMWPVANMLLSKLENEPDLRSVLANQVKVIDARGRNTGGLNAACIDRTALGFNTLVRELCKDYHADMSTKDFLLRAIHQMALLEADKQITGFMKENGREASDETYQAINSSIMKKLRKEIPDLPLDGIENVKFDDSFNTRLKESEREMLVQKVIEQFNTPGKIAHRLRASGKENAFMERRYESDLAAIKTEIEERQGKEYAKLDEHPDTPMAEYTDVDVRLDKDRKELISHLYASIVTGTGILNS